MSTLTATSRAGAAGIGLYVIGNEVYLVRPAKRNPRNRYAVNIGNLTTGHYMEPAYSPGIAYRLRPAQRMTPDQAKAYGDKSGRCAWCGRSLTDEVSILRGMGPTCFRRLSGWLRSASS